MEPLEIACRQLRILGIDRAEGILSQVQAAEMGFLRRVHGVTLRDKVRSCELLKALNIEPLLRLERSQLR